MYCKLGLKQFYENLTDIDEEFLQEIEDSGTRTFHTLQPRRIQLQRFRLILIKELTSLITVTQPPSSLIENLKNS